jgi:rhodanese-related sulfurtransferase
MSKFEKFETARPNAEVFEVNDIEPQELWQKREAVAIIDVRRPEEYTGELGHIPGAKMIVLDTLPDCLADIPRDKSVVFVCRSGARSARATTWALSEGFQSVYNLKGGMLNWQKNNMEVVKK